MNTSGIRWQMATTDSHRGDAAQPPLALRFASLEGGAAPLERLRSATAAALQRALAAIDASDCTLVLPHRLTTLLTHIFPSGLASLGKVSECVELTDELDKVHGSTVVYIAQPQVEDVRAIATHAGLLQSVQPKEKRVFAIIVAGTWTTLCADTLAHQQLNEVMQIEEAEVGFVPLDTDLLTLGRERCLYDCFIHGNKSVLVDVAVALQQLQLLYGRFEQIKYKGELAAFVSHQLMECELKGEVQDTKEPAAGSTSPHRKGKVPKKKKTDVLHTLVILDRSVDFASALSTPLTLEALVDELFESRDGFATLSLSASGAHAQEQVLALNASEPIFTRVRGLNIQAVSAELNAAASAIKTKFDRFRESSVSATTSEVHDFVKQVPDIKTTQETLERLVTLTEIVSSATNVPAFRSQWQLERLMLDVDPETDVTSVFDEVEDMIFRHKPLLTVLRVLCLYSVAHDGIPPDPLRKLKMRLLQTYGHELIFSFDTLERAGLLRVTETRPIVSDVLWAKPPRSAFAEAAESLKAIDLDVDPLDPAGMAFVTSGYAPISCRLIEEVLRHGSWEAFDSTLNKLSGPRAEIERKAKKRTPAAKEEEAKSGRGSRVASAARPQVLVVCIVGGVTYTEIAALRWLAPFYPTHQIVITSTSIINGRSFLNELLERIPSTT